MAVTAARATVLALACAACDAGYGGFLDAVPVEADGDHGPVEVFVAIDGLSRQAFDLAREKGAFATFATGDLVTPFPGTSDYAWTRILHAGSLPGYEIQYFDPKRNRLENEGLVGVVEHPVREGLWRSFSCYKRFDYLGDGYLWMARGYADPEAALPATLDDLFAVLETRGRRQRVFLAYLLNVDVLGHKGGVHLAADALVEIDRRIQTFKRRHAGRFRFTLFGDHGNAHVRARLVDPRKILAEAGVRPVKALGKAPAVEAVPVVHVRVTYVALHTHQASAGEVAARASRHRDVDLAVAQLGLATEPGRQGQRFGVFRRGERLTFVRSGDVFWIEQPARWRQAQLDVVLPDDVGDEPLRLSAVEALARTSAGEYPDLFQRIADAFTHGAAQFPADVILSLPDDVASYGFHVPGSGDGVAIDGFHGSLRRRGSLSVLASESVQPPAMARADELVSIFPELAERLLP